MVSWVFLRVSECSLQYTIAPCYLPKFFIFVPLSAKFKHTPHTFLFEQAMIVLAWNVGRNLEDAFNGTVVKQVLSIFITASILRLIQGKLHFLLT